VGAWGGVYIYVCHTYLKVAVEDEFKEWMGMDVAALGFNLR
jgi:hypothetical protein